jgi:hypothetical protein
LKTGLLPGINLILTILAVLLTFLPMIIYNWKRLAPDRSYLAIAVFWVINGVLYLPEIFHWEWYEKSSDQITLVYNLIDAPLIMLFFYYTFRKKILLYLIMGFIVFELFVNVWKGYNFDSDNIIIGTGSLICLTLSIWAISKYFMNVEHTDKENALVFAYAGYIFYYGIFLAVPYIFNYLNSSGNQLPYVKFINWIDIIIATTLISFGFWKFAHADYREEDF